jgi:sulfur carrier protein ThiS
MRYSEGSNGVGDARGLWHEGEVATRVGEPMQVTLKLYASLGAFLPSHAVQNEAKVEVADGTTVLQLLDSYHVPREHCHLVLINGVFQAPVARATKRLAAGDHVAAWPPVAGG